jgi:hypothetical protein
VLEYLVNSLLGADSRGRDSLETSLTWNYTASKGNIPSLPIASHRRLPTQVISDKFYCKTTVYPQIPPSYVIWYRVQYIMLEQSSTE